MLEEKVRGSEKVLAAWKARVLTEDAVREIASQFEKSPAKVESASVVGGESPTSVHLSLAYDGDDVPRCGNDLSFWVKWHQTHGGTPRPPRIIINGTPILDLLRIDLEFGNTHEIGSSVGDVRNELAGEFGGFGA